MIDREQRVGTHGKGWFGKAIVIALFDVICVLGSYFIALLVRFDLSWVGIPPEYLAGYQMIMPLAVPYVIATLWIFRLYHSIWSFASMHELIRLAVAWLMDAVMLPVFAILLGIEMPASFWIVGGILGFATTTATRFSYRLVRLLRSRRSARSAKRVMVVGAGESGRALIREIKINPQLGLKVVCSIDDNPNKSGRYIEGVPIVGNRAFIAEACEKYDIEQIIFAIPSISGTVRKEILELCTSTGREVKAIPGIYQLVGGEVSVSRLRTVRLEDLLGRDPIVVDVAEVRSLVEDRVILVTGGGGSIGSELCRQVASDDPKRLIIFDIYENNAYAIQQELRHDYPWLDLVVLIGSVRDARRVNQVFDKYKPEIVFHAAAHKHVPLMEDSPHEAIKNNVFGTRNCARAAVQYGAKRFVLISTDKAVNPTNVMGAAKRLCEMVVQSEERRARNVGAVTTFSAVRFGNVLGSNGSVVPLFKQQIANGGPVTVTDSRVTRYFMTIPEAVSLVLQSAYYAEGGEIFVLDMGEPVKIDDMARNLIRLAGYEPDVDIAIEYTGLRPGEKLYEERLMAEEGLRKTENTMISVARPIDMDDKELALHLDALEHASKNDNTDIRVLIANAVPTYHPELGA